MPARIAAALAPLLAVVVVPAVVAARLGAADAGTVFAAAWSVAVVLGAATTAVAWWSVRGPDPGVGVLRTAVERALTLAVPVVVAVLVTAPWILSTFGRHTRDTGVGTLVLLALATVPYAVVAVVSRGAAVRGRVAAAVLPHLVAAAVAVAGGWVLMPAVGVLGAGFCWLLGCTAVAGTALVRSRSLVIRPVA